jgi:putative RecB family exonuclease
VSSNAKESELDVGPGVYGSHVTYLKLSPSKASTWVDCPRRFFHTYVERRRPGAPWAHFSFGLSVHAALREWFERPPGERMPEAVSAVVDATWIDSGYRDSEQSRVWRARATEMVGAYVVQLDPGFQPFSTERTLAFKTDHFIMEGRIDRIDRVVGEGDQFTVVDYKTGKSVPTETDTRGSQALAMYALMVQRALGKPCLDVSLHHLPGGQQITWKHSDESLQRHLDRVSRIASDIVIAQDTWDATDPTDEATRDELFPAHTSAVCGFCDHWDVCADGRRFAERKESWEGLAADLD